jgi:hypothetical protein
MSLFRSELHRIVTVRSSWISMGVSAALGLIFGYYSEDFWSLFAGLGTFAIAVVTTSQHYQHRTDVLLFLAQPHRLRALAAQCLTAVVVALGLTVVSGLTVLPAGETKQYLSTLAVVPLMAVFGVANATVVRHPTWLLTGWAGWLIFVEGLIGRLEAPLPLTSFLGAAAGRPGHLLIFAGWTVAALAAASWSTRRDATAG